MRLVAMRLVDINPHWQKDDGRQVGINFDCPGACCAGKPSARDGWDARELAGQTKIIIAVPFKVAIDGTPYRDDGWDRTGETFETLMNRAQANDAMIRLHVEPERTS